MHDIASITPEHHTFEVIVEQPLGNASQVRKRVQMTPNEPGGIRTDRKTQKCWNRARRARRRNGADRPNRERLLEEDGPIMKPSRRQMSYETPSRVYQLCYVLPSQK